MDSLLANCLPYLSDHLRVQDLLRLEAVSKQLRETIQHGDDLFHRAIRGEVGYDNEESYPTTVPVKKFPDEEESKWKRYSAQSYPARVCFHSKLKHDGIAVEDLSVDKIREMGKVVSQIRQDLRKGATGPNKNDGEEEVEGWWDQWYCPGYLGLRGGYVSLDFKVVCGFVLVGSIREEHEYKHQYGYDYFHGFFDDDKQQFHYALKRQTVQLQSNDDIPYAYVPYNFYYDTSESGSGSELYDNEEETVGMEQWERLNERRHKVDVWSRDISSRHKFGLAWGLEWLKDGSGTIFAITMGPQLLRRKLPNSEKDYIKLQVLTGDKLDIAKKFLAPHVWDEWNANNMLGVYLTREEWDTIKRSLSTKD